VYVRKEGVEIVRTWKRGQFLQFITVDCVRTEGGGGGDSSEMRRGQFFQFYADVFGQPLIRFPKTNSAQIDGF